MVIGDAITTENLKKIHDDWLCGPVAYPILDVYRLDEPHTEKGLQQRFVPASASLILENESTKNTIEKWKDKYNTTLSTLCIYYHVTNTIQLLSFAAPT